MATRSKRETLEASDEHGPRKVILVFTELKLSLTLLLLLASIPGCGPARSAIPYPNDVEQIESLRVKEAVQVAHHSVANNLRSSEAWGQLGRVYAIHGWERQAVVCFRQARELAPAEFCWHYLLGRVLANSDPAAAVEAYSKAIEVDSDSVAAKFYKAESLNQMNNIDEARLLLKSIIAADPNTQLANLRLGELELQVGHIEAARRLLNRALQLNSDCSEAHMGLARIHKICGQDEEARKHAALARLPSNPQPLHDPVWGEVQLNGQTTHWYAKRATQYLKNGDFERAIAEFRVAVEDAPHVASYWMNFGAALLQANRFAEARASLERAAVLVRDFSSLSDQQQRELPPEKRAGLFANLGVVLNHLGETRSAADRFRESLSHDQDCYAAHLGLARSSISAGQLSEAQKSLVRCQELRPNEDITELLEKVSSVYVERTHDAAQLMDFLRSEATRSE